MSEFNICGVVVRARSEDMDSVSKRIVELPGAEVHAGSAEGRLVVTVEDSGEQLCIDTLSALQRVPGVVSASLVYQYGETK